MFIKKGLIEKARYEVLRLMFGKLDENLIKEFIAYSAFGQAVFVLRIRTKDAGSVTVCLSFQKHGMGKWGDREMKQPFPEPSDGALFELGHIESSGHRKSQKQLQAMTLIPWASSAAVTTPLPFITFSFFTIYSTPQAGLLSWKIASLAS